MTRKDANAYILPFPALRGYSLYLRGIVYRKAFAETSASKAFLVIPTSIGGV